jgi:hypothetical protein
MAGIAIGISQPTTFPLQYARFQRSYSWDIVLPDISIGLSGVIISQLVQEVSFGDYNITQADMKSGPYELKYAGLMKIGKVDITLLKTMPDIVTPYFNAWKELIVDAQGLYHPKNEYAKVIYVRFVDSTGLAVGKFKLIGAFPIDFPTYSLNYDDNKIIPIKVGFSVDKVEYQAI